MSVVFPPIFLVDTNLIYGYNFVAPLIIKKVVRELIFLMFMLKNYAKELTNSFTTFTLIEVLTLIFFLSDYPESFISGNIV